MKTRFEIWKEHWDELDDSTKVSIRNEYCREANNEDEVYSFDDEFFEIFFSGTKAIDVARAVFFGKIQSWSDEYIKFNGYGNLESMSEYDVVQDTESYYLDSIFDDDRSWRDEIDEDEIDLEYRKQHLDYIKEKVVEQLPDIDPDDVEYWFDNNWDDDCFDATEASDDNLVKECIEYLTDPDNQ